MKEKIAIAYEIVDHGLEHSQYFQGCGTCFTDFTDVATGIGDTAKDALDDALESLASAGWNVDIVADTIDDDTSASEEDSDEDSELHYHVSVRVREYDPEHDEPVMLLAATAIERLDALATDIHNRIVRHTGDTKELTQLKRLQEEREYLEGFLKENDVKTAPGWSQLQRELKAV